MTTTNEDLQQVLTQLQSHDPDERFEALNSLIYSPTIPDTPEVDEALVRATADPDPQVAQLAVWEVARRRLPNARDILISTLQRDAPYLVHHAALRGASIVDISPHLERAWQYLNRRLWVDRTAGAGALARAGVVEALPTIRTLARRARETGQLEAEAHLLGDAALLGDRECAEAFLSRVSASEKRSRRAARFWLRRIGRLDALAKIVGVTRLKEALLEGERQEQLYSTCRRERNNYAGAYDDLLEELDALSQERDA